MVPIGYIVQYSNEDDYTVYHGVMKLYRVFSEALQHAKEMYRGYLETAAEHYDGPFKAHIPTKKDCDAAGSVVVFESRNFIVWIDGVIE
jgi:hypothetical protein